MTTTLSPTTDSPDLSPAWHDQPTGLRTMLSDTLVFTRRHMEHIRQIPEKLLDVTVQPLMFVLLFAYVFGGAINTGAGSYREFLIGGIIIQTLTFGMMGPAQSIADDLTQGVIDRFRSLPAARSSYLLGHFLAELAGLVLSLSILSGTGLIVGWRIHSGIGHAVATYGFLLVFSSTIIWLGTWLGMVVRSSDAVMGLGFTVVFPLTFLSNAFVPIQSMPTWLQYVASWNPISVIVAAVRDGFGNPQAPLVRHAWALEHATPMAWAFTLGLLAVGVPLALRRYRARTAT
jgi:ABC transporter DrrB family efflux protein